jgi:hypothetical protein
MGTYEGKWRCGQCSSVNLGRFESCPSCGIRRPDDVRFFLSGDESEVNDAEVLQRAAIGPDWACAYCKGLNPANGQFCGSCGAARTEGKALEETVGDAESFREQPAVRPLMNIAPQAPSRRGFIFKRTLLAIATVIVVSLFGFIALVLFLTSERKVDLVVDRVEWNRAIAIEEYRQLTLNDWENNVPADAERISSRSELHHTDKVQTGTHQEQETYSEEVADGTERYKCGTRDKKNGFFEDVYCTRTKYKTVTKTRNKTVADYKDVPVYANKVTYKVWRWQESTTATESGADMSPRWPTPQLGPRQREGKRKETYHVFFYDQEHRDRNYDKEVSSTEFGSFTPGSVHPAKVYRLGRLGEVSASGP